MIVTLLASLKVLDEVVYWTGSLYVFYRLSRLVFGNTEKLVTQLTSSISFLTAANTNKAVELIDNFKGKHLPELIFLVTIGSLVYPVRLLCVWWALLKISGCGEFARNTGNRFIQDWSKLMSDIVMSTISSSANMPNMANLNNFGPGAQNNNFSELFAELNTESPVPSYFKISKADLEKLLESDSDSEGEHVKLNVSGDGEFTVADTDIDGNELTMCRCRLHHILQIVRNSLTDHCPISDDALSPDSLLTVLPCGHYAESESFEKWYKSNGKCHICREKMTRYNCLDESV